MYVADRTTTASRSSTAGRQLLWTRHGARATGSSTSDRGRHRLRRQRLRRRPREQPGPEVRLRRESPADLGRPRDRRRPVESCPSRIGRRASSAARCTSPTTGNNRVQRSARPTASVRGRVGSNTVFTDPIAVSTCPRTGSVFVVDNGNDRVMQSSTPVGTYQSRPPSAPPAPATASSRCPQGVATGILEPLLRHGLDTNRVQRFDAPITAPSCARAARGWCSRPRRAT